MLYGIPFSNSKRFNFGSPKSSKSHTFYQKSKYLAILSENKVGST